MKTELDVRSERVSQTPLLYQAGLRRAYAGTASPRSAIKAFCLQCVGEVRADVTNCLAYGCPLWTYRPYQAGEDEESSPPAPGSEAESQGSTL